MKQSIISSGTFSAKGNLFYTDPILGDIHVGAKKLAALGITDATTLTAKAPIFAIVDTKTINRRDPAFPDATGNDHLLLNPDGSPVTAERQEATCLFATKAAMIDAVNASKLLGIEADEQVNVAKLQSRIKLNAAAEAAGLDKAAVASLMESTLFN